ncbi:MAG: ABC transporter ATP-binding protein/permease [Planctomycetes bacterium]|nr:ABC transporter ATP-binding protein/permease [Planctomycetota bacterium]
MTRRAYLAAKARWIARAWGRHRPWVLVLVLMTAVSAGVTLAYPLVFGRVVDELHRVVVARAAEAATVDQGVTRVVAILLGLGLLRWVAALYPGLRAVVNAKIDLDLRERAFAAILRKGHRFFNRFRTGDVVTRLTDDIASYPKIAWFCCSGLFRALDSSTRVVVCLALMVWLDARLAAWALLPVPGMVVVFVLLHHRLGRATTAQRAAASETSDHLEAAFSGVTVVQAHLAEDRMADALRAQLERRAEAEVALSRLWVLLSVFFQALNVVGQLVVVVVGGLRVIDGTLGLGEFFAFYLYLGLLLGPMMDLPNLFVTARQAFVCMERLDELEEFDRAGEGGACRGAAPVGEVGRLALRAVEYAYPVEGGDVARPALRGVDLALARGERVALVGPIGGGKTTAARVLAGVITPDAGQVLLDGRPLAEHEAASFRRAVAFVPQDPVLFSATLRENVGFGRTTDEAAVWDALDVAGVADEVRAMPGGLDHEVGLRGRGLSGGQRQRLTIARALLGAPQVLVLDDITAALDAENEERFWRRVIARWPGLTALVVTHRLATARRMDRVVMLDEGRIVAQGRHDDLMRDVPCYRDLWRSGALAAAAGA